MNKRALEIPARLVGLEPFEALWPTDLQDTNPAQILDGQDQPSDSDAAAYGGFATSAKLWQRVFDLANLHHNSLEIIYVTLG